MFQFEIGVFKVQFEGAVLRLKFRSREAILIRAQSRNMPKFGQESQDLGQAQSNHRSIKAYFS